jgi:hypothetical protein
VEIFQGEYWNGKRKASVKRQELAIDWIVEKFPMDNFGTVWTEPPGIEFYWLVRFKHVHIQAKIFL